MSQGVESYLFGFVFGFVAAFITYRILHRCPEVMDYDPDEDDQE